MNRRALWITAAVLVALVVLFAWGPIVRSVTTTFEGHVVVGPTIRLPTTTPAEITVEHGRVMEWREMLEQKRLIGWPLATLQHQPEITAGVWHTDPDGRRFLDVELPNDGGKWTLEIVDGKVKSCEPIRE